MSPDCDGCGSDLNVNPVKKPNVDWVMVVCSDCGTITDVSMIRLADGVDQ